MVAKHPLIAQDSYLRRTGWCLPLDRAETDPILIDDDNGSSESAYLSVGFGWRRVVKNGRNIFETQEGTAWRLCKALSKTQWDGWQKPGFQDLFGTLSRTTHPVREKYK